MNEVAIAKLMKTLDGIMKTQELTATALHAQSVELVALRNAVLSIVGAIVATGASLNALQDEIRKLAEKDD